MARIEDSFDIRMLCIEEGIVIDGDDNDETDLQGNFAVDLDSLTTIGGNSHD